MNFPKVFSAVNTAVIALSLVSSPLAQTPRERLGIEPQRQAPRQTEEEKKAAKELEKKALALIDRLVEEGMSLKLVENRIHILAGASEALWARDGARARALVRETMDQAVAHMRKEKEKEEGQYRDSDSRSQFEASRLREKVLDLVRKRDAKLALEFLRLTRSLQPTGRGNLGEDLVEEAAELNLASQIAESDPQTALRIAEEHLSGELDHPLIDFWGVLQRKDPKAASPLTEKIISSLKSRDILADYEAFSIVFSALNVLRSRVNEIANARNNPGAADAAQLDSAQIQQAYRDALEIVVGATIKITGDNLISPEKADNARDLLKKIPNYLADIEKLFPSRAPAILAKVTQFEKAWYRNWDEGFDAAYGRGLHTKSLQELLALASKAQPGIRSYFYYRAIEKAIEQGDKEMVRKSVRENVLNESLAKELLSDLDRGNSERTVGEGNFPEAMANDFNRGNSDRAVSEGNFAEARKSLARMRSDEERAAALAEWSSAAAGKNDEKSAREMLRQARSLIGSRMQRLDQLDAQMAVAKAALDLDPGVSFEIAEAVIERLNRLVAVFLEYQTFTETEEGETRIELGIHWAEKSESIVASLLAALARKDFDRAVNLLGRWQSKEIRLGMSLKLVQNILGG